MVSQTRVGIMVVASIHAQSDRARNVYRVLWQQQGSLTFEFRAASWMRASWPRHTLTFVVLTEECRKKPVVLTLANLYNCVGPKSIDTQCGTRGAQPGSPSGCGFSATGGLPSDRRRE